MEPVFKSKVISIGGLMLGGDYPIRIQSMTTTPTLDTNKTVDQCIRLIHAGCELIRITAPSIHEAQHLATIKKALNDNGYFIPLIADIHYTPNAAELAARIVEKVRINPGNYADKKHFKQLTYTDALYNEELERIRERFLPLVRICKAYGTAMRIGTNHGSLSDRILNRYGDTPEGMVESAFEFLRICEDEGYHSIVFSMKASNTVVMVQAYRLLVQRMIETQRNYPIHLGVTEAGDGEDGRIKSAVGIGTLLAEGIGDTLRVSLTEDPEFEIPVAKLLANRYFERQAFKSNLIVKTKRNRPPSIVVPLLLDKSPIPDDFSTVGYTYEPISDKWHLSDFACDYVYLKKQIPTFEVPENLGLIVDAEIWANAKFKKNIIPFFTLDNLMGDFLGNKNIEDAKAIFVELPIIIADSTIQFLSNLKNIALTLVIQANHRDVIAQLKSEGLNFQIILKYTYSSPISTDALTLYASSDFGGLIIDGLGDGIWIHSDLPPQLVNSISFGLLQATRARISKTEYISCPSCGRTLFDLQTTTANIRSRTSHLKGLKIGIMGCIVNGPGEMADADYGYVGTGIGKITLYKGQNVMKRNIPSASAVDELIALIKAHGDWVEID